MKPKSKISVIVVCYNQEDTIARTLDSILKQEGCDNFEILVSDDCSTDRTASIAKGYAARYPDIVKVHVNASNQGVQGNYFGALLRAEGEYIADCAGDDFWCDRHKLAKEQSILDNNHKVSLVHTGFYYYRPSHFKDQFIPCSNVRETAIHGRAALNEILCGIDTPFIHLCTALYRRAPIIDALEVNSELFLNPEYKCEDLQVMTAAAATGDIAYLPEPTLCYTVGHKSISSMETFSKTFDFYFATTRLRWKLMQQYDIDSRLSEKALKRYTNFIMAQAFHALSKNRMNLLWEWTKKSHITTSLKFKVYYFVGKTPLHRFISNVLLRKGIH